MKSNYECVNLGNCDYTTNRTDNLKIRDLNKIVEEDGGYVKNYGTCCPKCKQNSLVYVSY